MNKKILMAKYTWFGLPNIDIPQSVMLLVIVKWFERISALFAFFLFLQKFEFSYALNWSCTVIFIENNQILHA